MAEPLISVVIRTYNRADRIERAIKSALAQDLPDTEVIVVDDGSTDQTRGIIERYPAIRYHYQDNQGLQGARLSGLRLAGGKYLIYLDSDDAWSPTFLRKSLRMLERHNAGVVFSNFHRQTSYPGAREEPSSIEGTPPLQPFLTKNPLGEHRLEPAFLRALFIKHMPAPTSSLLMRRELLPSSWSGKSLLSDDWMMILHMIFHHNIAGAFTGERIWTKWCDEDSVADGDRDHLYQTACRTNDRRVMLRNFARFMTPEEIRIMKDDIVDVNFSSGYALSNQRRLLPAWRHYARAFRHGPNPAIPLAAAKALFKKLLPLGR